MGQKAFSIFLASVAAPIIPGVFFSVGTPLSTGQQHWTALILPILGLFTVGYLITFVLVLLFGVPLFLYAERRGWARWWTALLASSAISFLFALTLRAPSPPQLNDFFVCLTYGVTASVTFWIVYRLIQSLTFSDE